MVWVVSTENRRVADSLSTSVTVPKWKRRSRGFRLSRLLNLLYCVVGLVAWNRTPRGDPVAPGYQTIWGNQVA